MKVVDEAGEPIKEGENRKSIKKSKLNFLNIEKSSNKVVPTMEEQLTVRLTNEFLSTKNEKLVPLYSKTKIWLWTSYANCKNIDIIPKKWRKDVDCNNDIDLQSRMYLLSVLQYSNFNFCDHYYIFLYERLQLIGTKAAILAVRVRQLWEAGLIIIYNLSLFKIIKSGLKRFYAFSCLKIKPLTQSANLMLLISGLVSFSLNAPRSQKNKSVAAVCRPNTIEDICSDALIPPSTRLLSVLGDKYAEPSILGDKGSLIRFVIESSKKEHRTNLRTK